LWLAGNSNSDNSSGTLIEDIMAENQDRTQASLLPAIDGQLNGGGSTDKFRIKIWDQKANDQVIYDNKLGAADDGNAATELGGGSIVIHSQ